MFSKFYSIPTCGQSLIEILITIGLAAILLPALLVGLFASHSGRAQNEQQIQATTQITTLVEAMRSIRESGWSSIATNGTYHPVVSGSTWALASGSATVNGFTQTVTIADVYRDASGNIATPSGMIDPSSKLVTATISWKNPYPSSSTQTFYLTRYLKNFSSTDTTVSDFSAGTAVGTTVTNTAGGEVALSPGGHADWCKPQDSLINTLTLPKKGNAIAALPGDAYVGTGDGTNGVTFVNVGITQPVPPASPAASTLGTYSSAYQTNAVFSDAHYVYLATNGSSSQIIILDVSQTPYTEVGWIDVPSGTNANGIYISGNVAYVTSSNKLYTFNVTTKTGAHTTPVDSISMWLGFGSTPLAKQVVVVNNYIYVGTQNTLFGLQRFSSDNDGNNLRLIGVSNLTWQQSSQGLAINADGSRAYIAFNQGAGVFAKGFFIVDTSPSDPPSWWPFPNFYSIVSTYNTGATDPRGMVIAAANRAIVVGLSGTQQYQVIDISNEHSPISCGGMAVTSGINGISTVLQSNGNAYSYIISGEAKDQFKIIQGGIGGAYSGTGTFESRTFDASSSAEFNSIFADINQPGATTIKMQVGVAAAINGACNMIASYTYLGPNNDSSQYYTPVGATISAQIPFGTYPTNYQNPGRCYRYKIWLSSTDINQTPVLYDASANYSL